ncbi:MAG: hypothetical protein Q7T57_06670 [Dehalococcoidales bacterium]|nr:hypothetical protein [Dehalococcoidales bacterium]
MKELEKEGYAPGTTLKVYGIVKRVFDAAKAVHESRKLKLISEADPAEPGAVAEVLKAMALPPPNWDLGKRSAPKVEASDRVKPAHTLEEIQTMVQAAKSGLLEPADVAYLALASVYGLRREELCRVQVDDFDRNTIFVRTAKGGEQRKQLLCEAIVPYLKYDFGGRYSPSCMSQRYWRICVKAGIQPVEGSGWHNFRRYLDTVLVETFGELKAYIFLRWKISSSSLMTERYYSRDPLEVDRQVLENGHPVVGLWQLKENHG